MSAPPHIDVRFNERSDAYSPWLLVLDRDGVLIRDTGYPHEIDRCILNEELVSLLAKLRAAGHRFGFASNQGGIGLGLYGWSAYAELTDYLDGILRAQGARPDFWLACAAHPRAVLPELRFSAHPWRKPDPGMILYAMQRMSADRRYTLMIGDRLTDMLAAECAGVSGMLFCGWPDDRADKAPPSDQSEEINPRPSIQTVGALSSAIEALLATPLA